MNDELAEGPVYNASQLRESREKIGFTQEQMAAHMGMSYRAYQAVETGQNPAKRHHVMLQLYAAFNLVASEGGEDMIGDIDPWLISQARKVARLADGAKVPLSNGPPIHANESKHDPRDPV